MKRFAIVSAALLILLQAAFAAEPKPQQSRPSRAPSLTSDDLLSPGASSSARPEERLPTHSRGPALQNARSVLEKAMSKMSEVRSVRIRMQTVLPSGPREILIETIAPDRMHLVSAEGEMIVIGSTFYLKSDGAWQVSKVPGSFPGKDSGFEFGTLVKQFITKSGVRITGHSLGDFVLDGVDTSGYEFEVSDRSETGSIQLSVGKQDGYIRRLSISGPTFVEGGSGLTMTVWFTNINEPLSIQPPM
jgi:hypothetical protein